MRNFFSSLDRGRELTLIPRSVAVAEKKGRLRVRACYNARNGFQPEGHSVRGPVMRAAFARPFSPSSPFCARGFAVHLANAISTPYFKCRCGQVNLTIGPAAM